MHTLLHEIRYALRTLIKSPGFAAIAILALALGIGANTAIFSVVNAVLLRPLPYPESDRLVMLREKTSTFPNGSVSYPNFLDWRAGQRSFTDLTLTRRETYNFSPMGGGGTPERVGGGRVTFNFLTIMGLKPLMGRDFTEQDDVPGAAPVALISERLWKSKFGRSANVLGKQVMVDGVAREIIGVLHGDLRFPRLAEIWVPLAETRKDEGALRRGNHPGFSVVGRLKPGVTMQQANADLDTIAVELERLYPDTNSTRRVRMDLLLDSAVSDYRASLRLLLGAVACVLLIACANVANLQLARALSRGKELAVRAALGASRWQLMRQMLIESTLLGIFGALAGMILALWSLNAILALSPARVARFQETRIDLLALFFTGAVALASGILVGLWPARRVSKNAALSMALHEDGARGGSGGPRQQRARSALVVTQVALAVVLLAGAGLTLKSFWRAQNEPINFEPNNLLTVGISLPNARYAQDEKTIAFFTQVLERVRALPGVESAAIGANIPFDESSWDSSFHVTGTPEIPPGQEPSAEINIVSPDYFRTMGMPILRGRAFGLEEVAGRPRSIIIDETLAQKFFPGQDPIGRNIDDNQTLVENAPPTTIVGVVARTRNEAPGENNLESLKFHQIYFCATQYAVRGNTLIVRVKAGDPLALVPAIKREVQALDPDQPIGTSGTMEKNIAGSLSARRLTMSLLAAFAGLALVLASVGIYGVMALSTTQRTRELGIRFALGASRSDVLRLVLGQGISLIAIGLVAGLAGAFAASRALQSLLYGVGTLDAAALFGALATLATVAFIACYLPARRASQVNPIEALRTE
ncbi:MAG TPA: ABC transporter permease [Chthoniobacterales bacterium]|nr:ABC transporter permease [Chthoniobacterales bacterium]